MFSKQEAMNVLQMIGVVGLRSRTVKCHISSFLRAELLVMIIGRFVILTNRSVPVALWADTGLVERETKRL